MNPVATALNLTRTDRIDIYPYTYGQMRITISDARDFMFVKQAL